MENTLFIGRNTVTLKQIDSTNIYAKQLLSNAEPPEGTVVYAQQQTAGKGQAGNKWLTEPGQNLTVSYILYPRFLDADKQFCLNMAIALGIKDCCEALLNDEIKIKWPNDIYYADNKLAGVLIENTISAGRLSSSVIGIGLNVNQQVFNALIPNPVSLSQIKNTTFHIPAVLEQLSMYIEKYYLQLRQLHFNFLDKAYTESLYRYQQTHEYKKGEQLFKGEINGVTKEGKLIVHSNGKELRFAFKEVEYVI